MKLYFDENGRISKEDARWRMRLSEGLAPYQDEKTGKYGYVGEDGTWVIAPTFDFARDRKTPVRLRVVFSTECPKNTGKIVTK